MKKSFYIVFFMRYPFLLIFCFAVTTSVAQNDIPGKFRKDVAEAQRAERYGQSDKAIKILESCIKDDPETIYYPMEIALIYFRRRDWDKAIARLETLRYHKQTNASVYELLARSYFMGRQEKKGVAILEKGLALYPGSGILCFEAGEYYLSHGDTTMALNCYEKGTLSKDNPLKCFYNTAILYGMQGRYEAAFVMAEMAMNLDTRSWYLPQLSKLYYQCSRRLFPAFYQPFTTRDSVLKVIARHRFVTSLDTACYHLLVTRSTEMLYSQNTQQWNKAMISRRGAIDKAGHLEAYEYWLMMFADNDGFNKWKDDNPEKWNAFLGWFRKKRKLADMQG